MQCASSITRSPTRDARGAASLRGSGGSRSVRARYEQQVDLVALQRLGDAGPLVGVVARDAGCAGYRRYDPRRSGCASTRATATRGGSGPHPRFAQEPRGNEVDRALAPARPLHDERAAAFGDQGLDGANWSPRKSASSPTSARNASRAWSRRSVTGSGCHAGATRTGARPKRLVTMPGGGAAGRTRSGARTAMYALRWL